MANMFLLVRAHSLLLFVEFTKAMDLYSTIPGKNL